jgi:hypothetical protein
MSGITGLLAIIRRGDVAALEKMLADNPGLANARDDRGNSPLLMIPDALLLVAIVNRGAQSPATVSERQ